MTAERSDGGDWGSAWGAFLLFASNVVAMVVAGTILLTLYGYTVRRGECRVSASAPCMWSSPSPSC